jgi:hypothetical protein
VIETGYLYPAPSGEFDMRFSMRTDRHYFVATDAETLEMALLHNSGIGRWILALYCSSERAMALHPTFSSFSAWKAFV